MKKQSISAVFYISLHLISSCGVSREIQIQANNIEIQPICKNINTQELTRIVQEEKNQLQIKQIDEQLTKVFGSSGVPENTTITRQRWRLLRRLGLAYDDRNMYGKSLQIYRLGLAMTRLAEDWELEAMALHDLGFSFKNLRQYREALECYRQALSVGRKIRSDLAQESEVATLNNIGEVYRNLKQYDRALTYYRQGLSIAKNHKDPDMQPIIQTLFKNIEQVQTLSGKV